MLQPVSPVHTQGGKLSLSCVAYGEPQLPDIIWSAPSLGVLDFAANDTVLGSEVQVTISNSLFNDSDTNLVFVVSTLELCGVNYTISFVEDFSCQAINGNYNDSTIGMRASDNFTMRPLSKYNGIAHKYKGALSSFLMQILTSSPKFIRVSVSCCDLL